MASHYGRLLPLSDGNEIPEIGFGTFDLGEGAKTTDAVTAALEMGYRGIDCARYYGNEREVGVALSATDILRQDLFVTSKVWNDRQLDGTVRQSIEESLRDLQVDVLDLLLVHWPVEGKFASTWKVFEQAKSENLVRSIGVSNFKREHLQELMASCNEPPVLDQMECSPYMQPADTIAFCSENDIRIEAWSPLGRGNCLSDPAIAAIASAHDATPAQVVIAWHVQRGIVPIPRSANPARMEQNITRLERPLSRDEIAAIDALDKGEPVVEGVDPDHFASSLNKLSSHFD